MMPKKTGKTVASTSDKVAKVSPMMTRAMAKKMKDGGERKGAEKVEINEGDKKEKSVKRKREIEKVDEKEKKKEKVEVKNRPKGKKAKDAEERKETEEVENREKVEKKVTKTEERDKKEKVPKRKREIEKEEVETKEKEVEKVEVKNRMRERKVRGAGEKKEKEEVEVKNRPKDKKIRDVEDRKEMEQVAEIKDEKKKEVEENKVEEKKGGKKPEVKEKKAKMPKRKLENEKEAVETKEKEEEKVEVKKKPIKRRKVEKAEEKKVDKLAIPQISKISGCAMAFGENDAGQLGLEYERFGTEIYRPSPVQIDEPVIQVSCGGMFTVCLSKEHRIYTFGCNDEGALARETVSSEIGEDEAANTPTAIEIDKDIKIVKISCGDSHVVLLTDKGKVLIWGSFRNDEGKMGLVGGEEVPVKKPISIDSLKDITIVDIASGNNHVLLLNDEGKVYSFGFGLNGELGRLTKEQIKENDWNVFLKPTLVDKLDKCDKIFARYNCSFARVKETGHIYGWGSNNWCQLGFQPTEGQEGVFFPTLVDTFPFDVKNNRIQSIVNGQFHTLVLNSSGQVYSIGKHFYGTLGIGKVDQPSETFSHLEFFNDKEVVAIAAVTDHSYAVTSTGELYSWGAEGPQIGHEEEQWTPTLVKFRKASENERNRHRKVVAISAAGQHVVLIVADQQQNGF